MASAVAIKTAKKELRNFVKAKLSVLSDDAVEAQSIKVFNKLISLKSYQAAQRIGIYLSMPSGELQTEAIVRHALNSGKVFVPYLYKSKDATPGRPRSVMEMVDLRSLADFEALERDSWGIPTIGADTVEEREHILRDKRTLDLILMPGVAFDVDPAKGFIRRLGHGKGFYDFFLQRYLQEPVSLRKASHSGNKVLLYGLALEEQLLRTEEGLSVPTDQHDSLLHGLLVGNGGVIEGPVDQGNTSDLE